MSNLSSLTVDSLLGAVVEILDSCGEMGAAVHADRARCSLDDPSRKITLSQDVLSLLEDALDAYDKGGEG
jgi:hypothetical protein